VFSIGIEQKESRQFELSAFFTDRSLLKKELFLFAVPATQSCSTEETASEEK
jgi:hypothetical protein